MNVKKDDVFDIVIEDMTKDGEGIGKLQGFPFFVKDAVIGDKVKVKVMKVKKGYAYARLERIIKPGKDRVSPRCPVARQCGGCTLQHLSYEKQLEYKYHKVENCLKRIGKVENIDSLMEPIIGMFTREEAETLDNHLICANVCDKGAWNYRNKAQFPVGRNKKGELVTGFYAGRSHVIIDQPYCHLQTEGTELICEQVKLFMEEYHIPPYDEETHSGVLRHILIRAGAVSGQVMVCLVINAPALPYAQEFGERLSSLPGMTSISYNVNQEKTNRILGEKTVTVWGEDTITDSIGGVEFKISPRSFYQVNPVQTRVLYEKALEYAGLTGKETVWDIYCGIGTISLFLARTAGHVHGVELVPEAIADAKENAKLNGFTNTSFYVGKAEEVLPREFEEHQVKADVIVVDPPRKGCDAKVLATMVKMKPERIVYVSCDPATLARDVKWLGEMGYEVRRVCPVDMFPQGGHVETVVQLVNIGVKPDYTVRLEVDVDEFYKTVGEEKRHFVKPDQKNKKDK